MATREQIAELYIATFNRAADADGLSYWDGTGMPETGEKTSLTELEDIAEALLDSPEVKAMYGDPSSESFDREAFIIKLYANILNRTVDATDDGVIYWVGSDISNAKMIIALINGAKAETGDPVDRATLENKLEVGLAFADADLNDVAFAISIMEPVTNDDATVISAKEEIDGMAPQVVGETFTLTIGADTFTGTDADDTINAYIATNSINGNNQDTISNIDIIDGGAC